MTKEVKEFSIGNERFRFVQYTYGQRNGWPIAAHALYKELTDNAGRLYWRHVWTDELE